MKKILIMNGPNLNLLGRREPGIYGTDNLQTIAAQLFDEYRDEAELEWWQSNHEGSIIDKLHEAGYDERYTGIVLNAGAYTHTSLAIADAIAAIPLPVVEVHLSNIFSREPIRHTSLIAPVCMGSISGFGAKSYSLAVRALL
ncbi:MAG: type II 3-dehydroquinate dehydratase [Bacteroidales bacterium]|nr:type II 3-dehydroquinate dehydratase [Bacteroidales bacterium]